MCARHYRPKRDDRVAVGQDVLRKHAHDISTQQLIPRIAVQNHIAIETISIPIYFYSKIRGGRRCSCFDIEASPNDTCRCCYGTGVVGGYEKYGTYTEVFDVTHPSIRSVNVIADYTRLSRPRQFVLIDGAVRGYVASRLWVQTNIGELDYVVANTDVPNGTSILAQIKAPGDLDWVEFSRAAVTQRLFNPWVDFRIELTRASTDTPSPRFDFLFVRYKQLTNSILKANIPRTIKSNSLQEFGVADDWQEQHFWLDNTLRSITTEDWVAHINEGSRWKIHSVNEFAPEDLLVSWDLDTRLIQQYQAMSFFPI